MTQIGILEVDGLPYILATALIVIGCLGCLFSFLVIVGYLRIGLRGQPHSVIYIMIALCCILYSFNALTQAVGFYGFTHWNGTNNTDSISDSEFVLCASQGISGAFPGNMMIYAYVIGMAGRIIATYAPLDYYRYFRYNTVVRIIFLFVVISIIEVAVEMFLVKKGYADRIGVCAGVMTDAFEVINGILRTFTRALCLIFLLVGFTLILRKFVKNQMGTAGDLSDDASKGIIATSGTYLVLSAFLPQQLVVMLYILANLTIGVYMMKERNLTSGDSVHNKETFFFLRLTFAFLLVLGISTTYGILAIYFITTEDLSETQMLQKYWGALVLFYTKEISQHLLGLINMVQMWKHTGDLKESLEKSALSWKSFKKIPFGKNTRLSAFMKMNNVKRPQGLFKRKRKVKRQGFRFKVEKRRKYQTGDTAAAVGIVPDHSSSSFPARAPVNTVKDHSPEKRGLSMPGHQKGQVSLKRGFSLKRLGSVKGPPKGTLDKPRAPGNHSRNRTTLPPPHQTNKTSV